MATFKIVVRLIVVASVVLVGSRSETKADMITLLPVPGFPTGANANALAGPLFSSALDSVDISGSGAGSAAAAKDGNFATHDFGVELDYSMSPGFFDSGFSGPFSRTSMLDHRATAESIFHFSVDVPTVFDVVGFFEVTDGVGTIIPGNVELEIELFEFESFDSGAPPPDTIFYSYQVSKSTIDQAFAVGGLDGDTASVLVGTPFGILDPSKVYRYRTLVTINSIDIDGGGPMGPTDGTASATGAHTILFGAATVPEPSTAIILLVGGVFTMFSRRIR